MNDNATALGDSTHRVSTGFFGTGVNLNVAGAGILVKQGTNATFGTVTLSSNGSAIVYSTKITASSSIFLSRDANGGTLGHLGISARSSGVSATIASSSATDTSTIGWLIVEPA